MWDRGAVRSVDGNLGDIRKLPNVRVLASTRRYVGSLTTDDSPVLLLLVVARIVSRVHATLLENVRVI